MAIASYQGCKPKHYRILSIDGKNVARGFLWTNKIAVMRFLPESQTLEVITILDI
ncbi:hypothetical protein ACWA6H_12845 [Pseudomonas bijieensis]